MGSDLFKKLRQWEEDDKAEDVMVSRVSDSFRSLRTKLDMLLGSAVTTLIFAIVLLFMYRLGVI